MRFTVTDEYDAEPARIEVGEQGFDLIVGPITVNMTFRELETLIYTAEVARRDHLGENPCRDCPGDGWITYSGTENCPEGDCAPCPSCNPHARPWENRPLQALVPADPWAEAPF